MLLRSITKHVKDQNWFAVALDFFIVVAGILIAFQVTNWNESRIERKLSHDYAKRLIIDLHEDHAAWQSLYSYYDDVLESVEEADRLLSLSDSDPKTLIVAAYRASEYNSHPTNRATWDQIVSSGHLSLLPKLAIGSGVSDYYKYLDTSTVTRVLDSPYRNAVRSVIPLPVQLSIRESCSDVLNDVNVAIGFKPDCDLSVDPAILNDVAELLRSTANIREILRAQYSLIAWVQINNEGNLVMTERVIGVLKEGMKN